MTTPDEVKRLASQLSSAAFNAGAEDAGDAWTRQEKTATKMREALKRLHDAIDALAALTRSTAPPVPYCEHAAEIMLAAGEHYAGVVLGSDGRISHHLIVLPGQADNVDWDSARAWASAAGGELPTRQEQALLYANLKSEFDGAWYWSAEPHEMEGSYAWLQYFYGGFQSTGLKSYEGRARAVRTVPIGAKA